ncbi:helix-turn-helix transcriptional regulator [Chromobacterium paludis]|uniref:AlpA family phage regulatory protein n=1 Tax=Chromobacterium paludis TaxID=2605945 RepID=A0A5C1DES7_9NEIS|nr:AlpA family phage regulatory protein [Chromobacterium paludis]QEL55136.1 AlpA family phage regulatory protein [Chromobacterium paludis]
MQRQDSPNSTNIAPAQARLLKPYGALPETGFVREKDLIPIIPFSVRTMWRRVAAGTFPAPLKISERVTAWRAEAIRQWLDEQGQAA